jgi:hypothetical protein
MGESVEHGRELLGHLHPPPSSHLLACRFHLIGRRVSLAQGIPRHGFSMGMNNAKVV